MAERRMFARSVIESDQFLDLPHSAQALYLHLGVNADDDGFVSNYKMIMRCCNAGPSDLEDLIRAGFIIRFESGILVIRHWNISNYIQKDRYTPSLFTEEKALLRMERGKPYTFLNPQNSPDTPCIHDVSSTDTVCTHSIGKESIGKESIGKSNSAKRTGAGGKSETMMQIYERISGEYSFSDNEDAAIRKWLQYKSERKEAYKETGLKTLATKLQKAIHEYGSDAVCEQIEDSISNGWKGIIWDRLKKQHKAGTERRNRFNDFEQHEYDFDELEKLLQE